MATNNFYVKNANNVYEAGDYEMFDGSYISKKIEKQLKSIFKRYKTVEITSFDYDLGNENLSDLSSYPMYKFGEIVLTKSIKFRYAGETFNYDVSVSGNLTLNPGYYDGANLDYILELGDFYGSENWQYDYDLDDFIKEATENFIYELEYYKEMTENQKERWIEKVENKLYEEFEWLIDEVINSIEKIYKDNTECLTPIATFSNGETIYQPCSA